MNDFELILGISEKFEESAGAFDASGSAKNFA